MNNIPNTKKLGYIIAVISAILYGLMPMFAKTVYASGSNSYTVVFLRMCIGSVTFFLFYKLSTGGSIGVTKEELKQLVLCSLGYGLTPILLYTSYNYLASGLATTLHFVYPVFVVLGSALFGIEKLTKRKVLCCVLCMAGIIAFYTPGGDISIKGIIIALSSGIIYAFYTVYLAASDLFEMDPYKLSFWKHLFSAGIVLSFALVLRKFMWPGNMNGWIFMLMLGLGTAAASFLYQQAAKLAGAQETSILSTFEPLTSVFVGTLVYDEQLTPRSIAGIICILASVILLGLEGKKNNSPDPADPNCD